MISAVLRFLIFLVFSLYSGDICISIEKPQNFIATGQEEGNYYKAGKALSRVDSTLKPRKTSGSKENLNRVKDESWTFGIVQSDVLCHYLRKIKHRDIVKVIGTIYHEPLHIIVRSDLHISSIDELKGKRVHVGKAESGVEFTARSILGIFGISDAEFDPKKLDYKAIRCEFRNKTLDAAFFVALEVPQTIQNLLEEGDVKCMELERKDLAKIASIAPYQYTFRYVTHHESKKKSLTVSVAATLIANKNAAKKAVVVNLAKELCDKSDAAWNFLTVRHASCNESFPCRTIVSPEEGVHFHEDAWNFYQKNKELQRKYRWKNITRYIFPALIFMFVVLLLIIRKIRSLFYKHKFFRIIYSLIFVLCICYIILYSFESRINNPDITGKPIDLLNMFMLVFNIGEIFCITDAGRIVKVVLLLVCAGYVAAISTKVGGFLVGQKIREVLKVIPNKSRLSGHLVICNWTPRIDGIIKEYRTGFDEKHVVIILTPPKEEKTEKLPQTPEYENVYLIHGNPAEKRFLERANISRASALLILAVKEDSGDPDASSLLALHAVQKVIEEDKSCKKPPRIIIEIENPDYRGLLQKHGADEVIAYSEIQHELLAQAIITPPAIGFIREILKVTSDSNEVYVLDIPRKYHGLSFTEFVCAVMKDHGNSQYPIMAVGIKRGDELFFNPHKSEFSKVERKDQAVVLALSKTVKLR